jgi:hypothetical protein
VKGTRAVSMPDSCLSHRLGGSSAQMRVCARAPARTSTAGNLGRGHAKHLAIIDEPFVTGCRVASVLSGGVMIGPPIPHWSATRVRGRRHRCATQSAGAAQGAAQAHARTRRAAGRWKLEAGAGWKLGEICPPSKRRPGRSPHPEGTQQNLQGAGAGGATHTQGESAGSGGGQTGP